MCDGWICDAVDAPHESWMSDAPWFQANGRHGHSQMVRTKTGVSSIYFGMGFVNRGNFLRQIFYGDPEKNRDEMTGLTSVYATAQGHLAQSAANVIDAKGENHRTSAWVIAWGPRAVYMVTPDGMPPMGSGEAAIVVADWRFVVRIANLDASTGGADLENWLDQALMRLPVRPGDQRNVRPVIYMHPALCEKLPVTNRRGVFIRPMDDIRCDEELVV